MPIVEGKTGRRAERRPGAPLKRDKAPPPVLLSAGSRAKLGRGRIGPDQLSEFLARLETLQIDGLRLEWSRRFSVPLPSIQSRDVLRRLLAWRVQAQLIGGYDRETLHRLRQLIADHGKGRTLKPQMKRRLAPGTVLSREWKGHVHRVTVETKGFAYEGKAYASLSEIARLITGTRWSGPRLFGLEGDAR